VNIHLLLAGVADIRYPLHAIAVADVDRLEETGHTRRILSPYDESALELALKLRDSEPDLRLVVHLLSGPNDERLLQTVAAHKPDHLEALALLPCAPWDACLTACQLASALQAELDDHSLLLVGREFGDLDGGNLPAALAVQMGLPLLSRVQYLRWDSDGRCWSLRERGTQEEWTLVETPCLVSVSNDKRSKLRHPLMKNVMLARKASYASRRVQISRAAGLQLGSLQIPAERQRGDHCTLLTGDVSQQVESLRACLVGSGADVP
tara:strand:- start:54672 stop:55466 length:795 start_codon:yes stop_codon:yes gene_type:complete